MADTNTLKDWFRAGQQPTQAQFWALIESYFNKDEAIPLTNIEGLDDLLDQKADKEPFDSHKTDETAHEALFNLTEKTENKGISNGYVPLDEFIKIASTYLNIVNDLVTGGSTALASAETVKTLKGLIDGVTSGIIKTINPASASPTVDGTYVCTATGTYTNFGGIVVSSVNSQIVYIIVSAGQTVFTQLITPVTISLDNTVIELSENAPKGKAVFKEVLKQAYNTTVSLTKNVYNPATDILNFYITNLGVITSSASYRVSDFIKVTEGSTYSSYRFISNAWSLRSFRFLAAYDANLNLLTASGVSSNATQYVVPVGVKYIRVSFYRNSETLSPSLINTTSGTSGVGDAYIPSITALGEEIYVSNLFSPIITDEGSSNNSAVSKATMEAAIAAVITTNFYLDQAGPTQGLNLFNPYTINTGQYITSAGVVVASAIYNSSDFIPVLVGETYTGNVNGSSANVFRKTCYYNSSFAVVAGGSEAILNQFTVPSGVAYVKVSVYSVNNPVYLCLTKSSSFTYHKFNNPVSIRWKQGFESLFDNDGDLATRKDVYDALASSYGLGFLELNGLGQDVVVSGVKCTRVLAALPINDVKGFRGFNFKEDRVGSDVYRTATLDDVAPAHFIDTTLLANHSYYAYLCVATAHGKVTADIGSIYTYGGNNYTLVSIDSINSLWLMASDLGDVLPENIVLTYTSGGSSATNITVTIHNYDQFFQCSSNYNMDIIVDDEKLSVTTGRFGYKKNVIFQETYNLITRSSLLNWYQTSYESTLNINGNVMAYHTVSYIFDIDGNCTIVGDFTFNNVFEINDIMALQAIAQPALGKYYIPKTIEFTHAGQQLNFSLLEDSTTAVDLGGTSINITPDRLDASSIPSDRWLQISDDGEKVFAMGFLPVGSAGINRAANVSANTLEIRGNTNKMYPRLVDKGDFNSAIGNSFSYVAYRNVFSAMSDETAAYPVRSPGDDYYYLDYHNTAGLKQIAMPSDYIGREIEIIENRNITCNSTIVPSKLTVNVNCLTDYGYLCLKIKK